MTTTLSARTRRTLAKFTAFLMLFALSANTVLAATNFQGSASSGSGTNVGDAIAADTIVANMAFDQNVAVSGFSFPADQGIGRVRIGMIYTRAGNANPHDDQVNLNYTVGGVAGASTSIFAPTTGALKTKLLNVTGDRAWTHNDISQLEVRANPNVLNGVTDPNTVNVDQLFVEVNALPVATNAAITPASPRLGQDLVAGYTYSDYDNDPETVASTRIRWFRKLPAQANFQVQAAFNNQTTIPTANTAIGDQWYFTVEPHDGINRGTLVTSNIVTVAAANNAPVFDAVADQNLAEAEAYTLTLTAQDVDGDTLTFSSPDVLPNGASLDANTGVFSWTPEYDENGIQITNGVPRTINFSVDDGFGGTAAIAVNFSVSNTNRAPTLDPIGDQNGSENNVLDFFVNGGDNDGDTVTYSIDGLDAMVGATFNANTGEFNWTPGFNNANTYPVTFHSLDGNGGDTTESVNIIIANTNRAPVLNAVGNQVGSEGNQVTIQLSANDDDGDALTYSVFNAPAGSNFDLNSGLFTWTPDVDQGNLNDTNYDVTFGVNDGIDSDTEDITISIGNVDRPSDITNPVVDQSVNETENLTFTVSATDPDGDAITLSADNLPDGATFDAGTGVFSWTPTYDQAAGSPYSVTFHSTSGEPGLTDDQVIVITVNNIDRAPVIDDEGLINQTVNEGDALFFSVSATDPDGDAVTYSADSLPAGATLDEDTGLFSWTPDFTQSAGSPYSITFGVTSGPDELTDTAEPITITVNNVNQAPTLAGIPDQTIMATNELQIQLVGTDDDGDAVTYSALDLPATATLDENTGLFSWTPVRADVGAHVVTFFTTDGSLNAGREVQITVTSDDGAPVLNPIEDQTLTQFGGLTITIHATDTEGDAIIYSATGLPSGATLDSVSGALVLRPANESGVFNVVFTATSGEPALSDSQEVEITVIPTDVLSPNLGGAPFPSPAPGSPIVVFTPTSPTTPTGPELPPVAVVPGTTPETPTTTPTNNPEAPTDNNGTANGGTGSTTASGTGTNGGTNTAATGENGQTPSTGVTTNDSNRGTPEITPTTTPNTTTAAVVPQDGISANDAQANLLGGGNGNGGFNWTDFALSVGITLLVILIAYLYNYMKKNQNNGK